MFNVIVDSAGDPRQGAACRLPWTRRLLGAQRQGGVFPAIADTKPVNRLPLVFTGPALLSPSQSPGYRVKNENEETTDWPVRPCSKRGLCSSPLDTSPLSGASLFPARHILAPSCHPA